MIHYYINPKTQELIAFDDETREVAVMEPVGGIIQTESKPAKPVSSPSKPAYVPNQRKQRLCSVCQKPGHTATTCLKNRPSNFGYSESSDDEVETDSKPRRAPAKQGRPGIDEATIKLIRELHDARPSERSRKRRDAHTRRSTVIENSHQSRLSRKMN